MSLLSMVFIGYSCSVLKKSKAEQAQISEEKDIAKANSEMRALQKAHYKRQAPDTKKMMKRSKKHSRKLNKAKITL